MDNKLTEESTGRIFEIMQHDNGEILAYELYSNGAKAMYPLGLGVFGDYSNTYVKAEVLRALNHATQS